MVSSINKVMLIGNVGNVEIRSTQDGRKIASIALATSESWKDKMTGERKEKTHWHRVVVFSDKLSEVVEKYVKKGTKLYVDGSLQTRKWTDNNGQDRYSTEIVLQGFSSNLIILTPKDSSASHDMSNTMSDSMGGDASLPEDDEIPF